MENQGQRRIWKPKKDYKSNTPSKFGKGVFLPKDMKKKFEEMQEAKEEENSKKE
ncbi:hypothetical protein K0B04_04020 [Patescibacteria group bacterium]|nr:hypothetical protein [Patescibacteria group bacterium]